ncbi:hypothetical protein CO2235_10190 [Cupriavidus oxalaticus]|uniref:Uncharacterized protein n=1 Tax=Cupriavidus oxalaticus TaxID=96344 RepID=A0A375FVI7_9BURK|nr:hypothetical protein CO2235_10190 [Cupriavidus oxalaticus]
MTPHAASPPCFFSCRRQLLCRTGTPGHHTAKMPGPPLMGLGCNGGEESAVSAPGNPANKPGIESYRHRADRDLGTFLECHLRIQIIKFNIRFNLF